jgi:hypothetical protein
MPTFVIDSKRLVPIKELDHEDKNDRPWGRFVVLANDSEEALDIFHSKIGIACLDHFKITCFRAKGIMNLEAAHWLN